MRLALYGFGNVGRALARMLLATRAPFTVTALATNRHGAVVDGDGIDLVAILAGTDLPLRAAPPVASLPADVLVEMTPLEPRTGEPALTYIREALTRGHARRHRQQGSDRAGVSASSMRSRTSTAELLRFEATLADCLPVFTLRRAALPLAKISAIRGIVSSTNNHILTAAAAGVPFADALAEAQRLGIAEADPRNDLEGHDAAAKATILANVLMDADLAPEDVSREPIDEQAADTARVAAQNGDRVRPVIEIARRGDGVAASFGPRRLGPLDPLYAVDDFSMGLVFETDLAGRVRPCSCTIRTWTRSPTRSSPTSSRSRQRVRCRDGDGLEVARHQSFRHRARLPRAVADPLRRVRVHPARRVHLPQLLQHESDGRATTFAGLDHYLELLTSPAFRTGLLATTLFAVYTVPIGIALGLVLAVMLNQRLRGINVSAR